MLEKLKSQVCEANLELVRKGLVIETWGNASALDPEVGAVVIKPSGIAYSRMKPADMVVVSLDNGSILEGEWKPSSDTATHLEIYRAFTGVKGVVHTHSPHATAWAQAKRDLLCFGTTQADYWNGRIPCTRPMTTREIQRNYEANTGRLIIETFRKNHLDPLSTPAVLVACHGPFAWGEGIEQAVHNAVVLEFCAGLALQSLVLNPRLKAISSPLQRRHYFRKNGNKATYGQKPLI